MDIPRPGQHTIFLAACPCTAYKAHNLLFSGFLQTVIKALRIHHRINIAALQRRSRIITVIVKIVGSILRLGFIQPEDPDSLVIIILFAFIEDKLSCSRMCGIIEDRISHPGHVITTASVCPDKVAIIAHLSEIFASFVNSRPYGNYCLNSKLLQFLYHRLRIRPVTLFELKVTLHGPVKKVNNNGIHGKTSSLMLPCYLQKLLLITVAQLALPVTKTKLRHHGRTSRGITVLLFYLSRCIPCCNKIVDLFRPLCIPLSLICPKGSCSDRRVIPEKSITPAGYHKGNAGLTVSLCKFKNRTFLIQVLLLILSHTIDLFIIKSLKPHGHFIFISSLHGLHFPGINP